MLSRETQIWWFYSPLFRYCYELLWSSWWYKLLMKISTTTIMIFYLLYILLKIQDTMEVLMLLINILIVTFTIIIIFIHHGYHNEDYHHPTASIGRYQWWRYQMLSYKPNTRRPSWLVVSYDRTEERIRTIARSILCTFRFVWWWLFYDNNRW